MLQPGSLWLAALSESKLISRLWLRCSLGGRVQYLLWIPSMFDPPSLCVVRTVRVDSLRLWNYCLSTKRARSYAVLQRSIAAYHLSNVVSLCSSRNDSFLIPENTFVFTQSMRYERTPLTNIIISVLAHESWLYETVDQSRISIITMIACSHLVTTSTYLVQYLRASHPKPNCFS